MEDKELEEALAASIDESFNKTELDDIMNEIENLEKEFSDEKAQDSSNLALAQAKDNSLQEVIDKEVANVNDQAIAQDVAMGAIEPEAEIIESKPLPSSDSTPELATQDLIDQAFAESKPKAQSEAIVEPEIDTEDEPMLTQDSSDIVDDTDEVAFSEEELADITGDIDGDEVVQEESNVVPIQATSGQSSHGQGLDFSASGNMDLSINFNISGQTAHLKVENGSLAVHLNGVQLTINEESGCTVKMAQGVQFSVPLDAGSAGKKAA